MRQKYEAGQQVSLYPNSFLVHAYGMNPGWSKALILEKHPVSLC